MQTPTIRRRGTLKTRTPDVDAVRDAFGRERTCLFFKEDRLMGCV